MMIQFYSSYGSNLTINLQFYNLTNLQIYKFYNFNKIKSWQYIQLQLQFYNFAYNYNYTILQLPIHNI